MNFIKAFAFTLVAAFALSSCNNVEKILPKKDGLWNITSSKVLVTVDGTVALDTTYLDQGTMMFVDDGTGTTTMDTNTTAFTWSYDKDADEVSVTSDGATTVNAVLESSSKAQTWSSSTTIVVDLGVLGTITTVTEATTQLDRAE